MPISDGIHEFFAGDVQYPYADVGASGLMHISKISKDNRRSYTYKCPYCNTGLHPRLGEKQAHCFAHDRGKKCDPDRYIHKTAERLLAEKWDRDEPFEVKMKVRTECQKKDTCAFYKVDGHPCIKEEEKTYNLKELYTRCVVEKKYGDFIPDLCLIDDKGKREPIFIEIWSKHKNSEEKANSIYKIIEIRLKTMEELEDLPRHPLTESETVTFSHFKTLTQAPPAKDGPHLMRFTLYAETLRTFVDSEEVFCGDYKSHHRKAILEIVCSQIDIHPNILYKYGKAVAIDRGFDFRSCDICRHSNYLSNRQWACIRERETDPVACKTDDAKKCPFFVQKDDFLQGLIANYSNVNQYIWIKNADGTVSEEVRRRKEIL